MSNYNTIVLKGKGHHDEGEADSAILPGAAIEMAADGKFDELVSSAGEALKGVAGIKIAKEDSLQGKTITDAYAQGDRVFYYEPIPGDEVNILVKSGEDIAVGDTLIPEIATGQFVEAAGSETDYWFEALESTGGALGAADHVRCKCTAG